MASCGRLSIGLVGNCILVGRPSTTRPQDAILPHKRPTGGADFLSEFCEDEQVRLNLHLLDHRLAICRLAPADGLPAWATAGPLTSITRTATELSVVCPESVVPEGTKSVTGWRVFQVEGVLDFALTGILASLAQPLAEAGVSLFALSTYDTDYVLVQGKDLERTIETLTAAGHHLTMQSPPAVS
jgi:hypothetical protein